MYDLNIEDRAFDIIRKHIHMFDTWHRWNRIFAGSEFEQFALNADGGYENAVNAIWSSYVSFKVQQKEKSAKGTPWYDAVNKDDEKRRLPFICISISNIQRI